MSSNLGRPPVTGGSVRSQARERATLIAVSLGLSVFVSLLLQVVLELAN